MIGRTAQFWGRGVGERVRSWADLVAGARKRAYEGGGAVLVLTSLLLILALLTYNPRDPSLDTAIDGPATNFLGHDGAYVADALMQSVGLAAYLIPVVLLGWAFRLLLQRPLKALPRRVGMLLLALILGATACSILDVRAVPLPAGTGGAVGWTVGHGLERFGLGAAQLPVAMVAAAMVALLLLSVTGLSPRDWRDLMRGAGRGASRLSTASGRGTVAAAVAGAGWWRRYLENRREAQTIRRQQPSTEQQSTYRSVVTPMPERREPRPARTIPVPDASPPPAEEPVVTTSKLVRLVIPRARPPGPGRRAELERQPGLALELDDEPILPELELLTKAPPGKTHSVDEEALAKNARMLEAVLEDYGVRGQIVQVRPGPVVTLYELEPAPGIKASRVIGLADDIARSMSAISVRVAVVPGRTVIGIELPNAKAETVYLRELLDSPAYEQHSGKLALTLGKDIGGEPVIADLARMPHLLIAGTTGSGKSVGINTMILSILYRMPPQQCKFIMVDPKMLELSVYDGIPHLLAPVVTDPRKAILALKWTVREMESRYHKMSKLGVRNIEGFNQRLREAAARGESLIRKVQTGFDADTGQPIFEEQPFDSTELPFIVVVVDEMADLMLVAGKEIEAAIQRLAQMARAAGIHIIMATQRPSVDVITGTIKANFPTRVSFQVTSKIDSHTILGEGGAEQLLGRGDMLYMAGGGRVTRVHGPFVSDEEVERVVSYLKRRGNPSYIDEITEDDGGTIDPSVEVEEGGADNGLYDQAVALVCRERKASTSFVQRHLQIGYNRAARIIERMEADGVVSQANHVGKREVLAPPR
ncbi:MAG TPA: DNA translocase FtsK 4TM domain-containing protein [Stellaceae bacterium]|nr:DNA translocase FtsK 4TM domain-containing protein [Stellaceae bacterium]